MVRQAAATTLVNTRVIAIVLVLLTMCGVATEVIEGQSRRRGDEPDRRESEAAPATRIETIAENGGRLDWSAANNLITFDRRIGDGYFDVYTMTPSGSDITCLTCGKSDVPAKSKGNPVWHPSGDFIAFQSQNTYEGLGAISKGLGKITDYFANPGSGVNNDVWIMDRQGKRFWRLTNTEPRTGGVLHPQFSRAGDKLYWAERLSAKGPMGEWALKVADFSVSDGTPKLSDIKVLQPGRQHQFYESSSFSPDGERVLFSGNLEPGQKANHQDIYLYQLRSGDLRNLTNSPKEWDEHAHFSPDGKTIIWMSSKDLPGEGARTDYWLMDADGGNKRRLTYFNTPGHPEYSESPTICADSAWSPDGSRLAAYLIADVRKGGKIVMIDLRRQVSWLASDGGAQIL